MFQDSPTLVLVGVTQRIAPASVGHVHVTIQPLQRAADGHVHVTIGAGALHDRVTRFALLIDTHLDRGR